jgi:tRNA G10  N-methylase Trm11
MAAKINEISAEKVVLVNKLATKTNLDAAESERGSMVASITDLSAQKSDLEKKNAELAVKLSKTERNFLAMSGRVNFLERRQYLNDREYEQLCLHPSLAIAQAGFSMDDIVQVKDTSQLNIWVFRFNTTNDLSLGVGKDFSVSEMNTLYGNFFRSCKIVTVDQVYVYFIMSQSSQNASALRSKITKYFKNIARMEVLSPMSLSRSVVPFTKTKYWTEEMFDALVSNVRAATSVPDSPAAGS